MSQLNTLKICRQCVLPNTFPGIRFNEHEVCHFCLEYPTAEQTAANQAKLKEEMAAIINQHKGQGEYDCIVAFSGGKDSSYILMMLTQEYGLKCLAITIDNGFISERAVQNGKAVTSALGVDHIMFTPAPIFMNNMYVKSVTSQDVHAKAAIKRASNMCNSCINLINNYMLKTALQHRVTLIAGGYISGQVPKDSASIRLDLSNQGKIREVSLQRYVSHFGNEASKYFGLNPSLLKDKHEIYVLNPMLSISITEEQIKEKIAALGWEMTKDTGRNSSNCMLNDLGIAIHYKQHQFNPYVFEISEQVRQGLISREAALEKCDNIPEFTDLSWQMNKLGLNQSQI